MASINVQIFEHEKDAVVKAIKTFKGATTSVSAIAKVAGTNPNRTRFIIEDLIVEDRVKRVATKAFNARYIRYSYEVLK